MGGRYPIAVLIAMLIAAAHAGEPEAAALSGGSRLIFYYTSRSIAHPDAGAGATTIVSITNHSSTTPARVIAWVRRADCTSFGFFERVVGVNETWRFVPADLAPPGEAGEGWVDAYALDPASRLTVWDEVRRINQRGVTVFLTTQYLEEADQLCGRIAIIDGGRIVREGTPAGLRGELRDRLGLAIEPTLDDVFLDATGRTRERAAGEVQEVTA